MTLLPTTGVADWPESAQFDALDNFTFGAALPPVVPEPSSFALLGSGLLFGAGALRRRVSR